MSFLSILLSFEPRHESPVYCEMGPHARKKNKLHWGSHDGTFQSLSDLSRMYSLLDGWKLAHLALKREEKGAKSVTAKRIKLTSDLQEEKGNQMLQFMNQFSS